MMMNNKVTLLYSGGSDSTLAAALLTKDFDEIHLLSYVYTGVVSGVDKSKVNVIRLQDKYKDKKFVHKIIYQDKLYKEILYGNYLKDILKHRFLVLAMCPICKIAMFTRALVHSLDHGISHICDGANRGRGRSYPEQVQKVMKEFDMFLGHFNVKYSSPVYELNPQTDEILYEMGLYETKNVKHDPNANLQIEGDCTFKSLYHTASVGYYRLLYGDDKYEDLIIKYYRDKFDLMKKYVEEYLTDKKNSKMYQLIN